MGDACECIWNHNAVMDRLMEVLRSAQDACTDSECSEDQLGEGGNAVGTTAMLAMWGAFALGMYMMRPNSMREGEGAQGTLEGKPAPEGGGGGGAAGGGGGGGGGGRREPPSGTA